MASDGGILDGLARRRSLRAWTRAARGAEDAALPDLRRQLDAARGLRAQLDRLIHTGEARLAGSAAGDAVPQSRPGTDWWWRPEIWNGPLDAPGMASVPAGSALGAQARLFHDCPRAEIALRQVRNRCAAGLAPYALQADVFGFDGSYLSLALEVPDAAAQGLQKRHVIAVEATIETERPLEVFVRLNIRHGPNTEQLVREVTPAAGSAVAEFDLAYTRLNDRRTERLWLDLIFERPAMTQIVLRDVTMSRRVRAQI